MMEKNSFMSSEKARMVSENRMIDKEKVNTELAQMYLDIIKFHIEESSFDGRKWFYMYIPRRVFKKVNETLESFGYKVIGNTQTCTRGNTFRISWEE